MSLETTDPVASPESALPNTRRRSAFAIEESQWESLQIKVRERNHKRAARDVLGESVKGGGIYRWGVAAAEGSSCGLEWQVLSRFACASRLPKRLRSFDCQTAAKDFLESLWHFDSLTDVGDPGTNLLAARAVVWAAALPELTRHLNETLWWDLMGGLQQLRESVLQRHCVESPAHLLVAAELGLTMAWKLVDVPSCKRLQKSSCDAFADWCRCDEEAINHAVAGATDARLALASFIRCKRIIASVTRRKFKKSQREVGAALATWVAALTTTTGGSAFSQATRREVADDLTRRGLLAQATEFDAEALEPATEAALGKSPSGGRLAWEVCLPEAFHHADSSKLAVMFPDWDVRRGRLQIDYSSSDHRIELFAGRLPVLAGECQTMIELDGVNREPSGPWEMTCEYSDDDVHYLELEQPWTGDLLLQRQWMLIRDDRCVLFADGVLPSNSSSGVRESPIRYQSRLPLAPSMTMETDAETREVFLGDGKRRGLMMPLSATEWRVGPTAATLNASDDDHLVIASQGSGRLYVPLWFDFQQRRFKRPRTWRQLTVADQLRIVDASEAVGFRVQVGSQHWMIYRSLDTSVCRSLLGKHLIADFFAARFDPEDGSLEDLVTVDSDETHDD